MTRDSRIGLLVGLLFILAFGLILTEMVNPPNDDANTSRRAGDDDVLATYTHARTARSERPPRVERPRREDRSTRPPMLAAVEREREDERQVDPPLAQTYRVREGDTLRSIARRAYGAGQEDQYRRIYAANRDRMRDERTVYPGQVLLIPPLPTERRRADVQDDRRVTELTLEEAEERFDVQTSNNDTRSAQRYVVRSGDTLSSIARRYMGDDRPETVRRLYEANRGWIADPNRVPAGMELVIP
ncbi:MAG: LysM peptidoglycan-binding domain-containing protein [Planctomycetota bacterium]|jgi:nucleoid-associated protein YgaU